MENTILKEPNKTQNKHIFFYFFG